MKNFNKYLFTALTASLLLNAPASAEYIFLKDGSIVAGKIENESPASVSLIKDDGTIQVINTNDIMRVLYKELYMGRVYVQKTDGKGLELFMVDENREYYIFRHEINKPEEVKIKRTDVLFMARKNPTGLQAVKVDTDRIDLTWLPPYNKVKYYRIYFKSILQEKYNLAGETSSKSFTIKNLTSNTQYFLKVTAVDKENYESLPSNEITEKTRNIPPYPPKKVKMEGMLPEDKTSRQRKVTWEAAADPDGVVVKYRVFTLKKGKKEPAGETKDCSYKFSGTAIIDGVMVTAVDNMGAESDPAQRFISFGRDTMLLSFVPGAIFPVGKFGEMYGIGFGGMVAFTKHDLFFDYFEGGVALGFYSMRGKDLLDERNKIYQDLKFIPLYVTAGYNIESGKNFYIKPVISFGGAFLDAGYKDALSASNPNKRLQVFEPSFKAGIAAEYWFTYSLSISAGCEYGAIIEKNGVLSFVLVNAGAGFAF